MAQSSLDVLGIGNAIVDIVSQCDDRFLADNDLDKGAMTLVGAHAALALYEKCGPGIESSGGSAANTMAGIASLGGQAAYIGKVRDDELGRVFRHDIRAAGVRYNAVPAVAGPPTARCLVLVTPDAQRTMQTCLGISAELTAADVDLEMVRAAKVTYLEGYLFDPPDAKEAFRTAARAALAAGGRVALSLSDAFCVDRHRKDFLDLIAGPVDILFANEAEILSLYQVDRFDEAVAAVRGHCEIAALTRSAKGAVVLSGEDMHVIDAAPVGRVVDTTGAGDLFAAGFLYGLTRGLGPAIAGRIGAIAAAEVIGHLGARPAQPLDRLVQGLSA
ncbi:MAG: adenosine kinase [Alphaproteobacteria bacterium]